MPGYAQSAKEKEIEKVLLTPKTATLWIKETVSPKQDMINFDLPPQAIVETLNIQILEPEGVSVSTVSDEWLEERPEKEVNELLEKIKLVEKERDALKASQDVIGAEIEAWKEQSRRRQNQFQDVLNIIEEARKNLLELHSRLLQIGYELKAKNDELDQLNRRLNEMTGAKKKTRRIYCKLSGLPENIDEITIRYWFTMREAEWRPVYRFELFPSEERLSFIWDAEITQRSGFKWSNVDITLATSELKTLIYPPELPPWVIEPIRSKKQHREGALMMKAAPSAPSDIVSEEAKPEIEEKSAFNLYHLGHQSVESGKTAKLRVMNGDWRAQVYYLMRPFVAPWAFIQAKVSFDNTFQVPQGEGLFFLDGTFISRSPVSIQGLSQVFSFGSDPMVSSKFVLEEKQTGRKGFLKGKQTFLWKWHYEIENSHSFPITLRFEERKPQIRDERIEVKFVELPALKEFEECSPDRWCWELVIKEREKKILRFTVQAEAPEDMEIFPGW